MNGNQVLVEIYDIIKNPWLTPVGRYRQIERIVRQWWEVERKRKALPDEI